MEVCCATLSLPRPSPSIPSISSCNSTFFNNGRSSLVLKNNKRGCLVLSKNRTQRRGLITKCLFGLGVPELAVIAGVVALVFGPKKLPEVGRSIGKTVKSFQQAAKEFESELKKDPEPLGSSTEQPTAVSEDKQPEKQTAASTEEKSV